MVQIDRKSLSMNPFPLLAFLPPAVSIRLLGSPIQRQTLKPDSTMLCGRLCHLDTVTLVVSLKIYALVSSCVKLRHMNQFTSFLWLAHCLWHVNRCLINTGFPWIVSTEWEHLSMWSSVEQKEWCSNKSSKTSFLVISLAEWCLNPNFLLNFKCLKYKYVSFLTDQLTKSSRAQVSYDIEKHFVN
jgi:hypothetical protein